MTFVNQELRVQGVDPPSDLSFAPIPWESLRELADYATEGFQALARTRPPRPRRRGQAQPRQRPPHRVWPPQRF